MKSSIKDKYTVIVPAAGAGKRMLSSCPKQYLVIGKDCVLTHTVNNLLSHPLIHNVIVSLSENDEYFETLSISNNPRVHRVVGGEERVNSVLNGLKRLSVQDNPWVLVHDAARPCVTHHDITLLIERCISKDCGGLLALPVVDTLKQSDISEHDITKKNITKKNITKKNITKENIVQPKVRTTVDRRLLWQALTPQMYKTFQLTEAIETAIENSLEITDESSAIELANLPSMLVSGNRQNIKITRPEDLALAAFYLENTKR